MPKKPSWLWEPSRSACLCSPLLIDADSQMRELRCTLDSSCVIALEHLNLLPQLSFLFSRVLVPKAVRMDLFKRRGTKDRIRSLFDTYAFFQRCNGYETGAVDFLLAERARQGMRDRGEVEAVVQASQFGAAV